MVLDLTVVQEAGLLDEADLPEGVFGPSSEPFHGARPGRQEPRPPAHPWTSAGGCAHPARRPPVARQSARSAASVAMHLPVAVGDYTDFYSSREHATNVGVMFRGEDNALMPNWLHLPVGYHGRASSLVVSGTDGRSGPTDRLSRTRRRPPVFGPSSCWTSNWRWGSSSAPRQRAGRSGADRSGPGPHLRAGAGERLVGARHPEVGVPASGTLQREELRHQRSRPWVVPLEALEPFRCAAPTQDPGPCPYLARRGPAHLRHPTGGGPLHAAGDSEPHRSAAATSAISTGRMAQQLAHHTVTGCNLQHGRPAGLRHDQRPGSRQLRLACWKLPGEARNRCGRPKAPSGRFLADGDTVTMTAWCQGDGYRVGFGEVFGTVLPARPLGGAGR